LRTVLVIEPGIYLSFRL